MTTQTSNRGKREFTAEHVGDAVARRGLPADPAMERAVLGCCLLANEVPACVSETLDAGSFLIDKHQTIFRAMMELAAAGTPIDVLTLEAELKRAKAFGDAVLAEIMTLTESLPVVGRVEHYVEIVAEKARLRRIVLACNTLANEALEGDTPASEIAGRGAGLMIEVDQLSRAADILTLREALNDAALRKRLFDPHVHADGIKTGFPRIDDLTGGLTPGEFTVLAARPSMGKTALALTIAEYVSRTAPVLVLSFESTRAALMNRLVCAAARVDSTRRRLGYLNADEYRKVGAAIARLANQPIHFAEAAGATLARCVSIARRTQAKEGSLGLIVLDHIQLIASAGKVENRTQEVSAFSRGLSRMAHDLHVPVLALSQLSRETEKRADPRPKLSDLRDSGSIEQDADRVMLLFRPEVHKPDREDLRGIAEVDIAKQRDGPTAVVRLAFLKSCGRFDSLAEDYAAADDPRAARDDEDGWRDML